jgi:hypothetical protein
MLDTWRASLPASLATALAALVFGSAVAYGAPPTPPASSAIAQYVEMVPTSSGSAAPGVDEPEVAPLPEEDVAVLEEQAPEEAPALQVVATSSTYGAPVKKLEVRPTSPHAPAARVLRPERVKAPAVPSPTLALGGGTPRSVVWVGILMLATTCVLVGATIRRRRSA